MQNTSITNEKCSRVKNEPDDRKLAIESSQAIVSFSFSLNLVECASELTETFRNTKYSILAFHLHC